MMKFVMKNNRLLDCILFLPYYKRGVGVSPYVKFCLIPQHVMLSPFTSSSLYVSLILGEYSTLTHPLIISYMPRI